MSNDVRATGGPNDPKYAVAKLVAARSWHMIEAMLDSSAVDPNREVTGFDKGWEYTTSLLWEAVQANNVPMVRKLLSLGANPSEKKNDSSLLVEACTYRRHEIIELLLDAGAKVDARVSTSGGSPATALMAAAEKVDLWAVERLLRAGADATIAVPKRMQTALWFAAGSVNKDSGEEREDWTKLVRTLVAAGCAPNGTELHWPVFSRNAFQVRELLALGCPVNERLPTGTRFGPWKGSTPLTNAVECGPSELGSKPDPAALRTQTEIVRMLLDAGADPNLPGAYNETPLHIATRERNVRSSEIVDLLLAAGATPDAVS